MTPTEIASELGLKGHCICPDFLPPESLVQVQDDFAREGELGNFTHAGTGHGNDPERGGKIRSDSICWLERGSDEGVRARLWEKMDSLQTALNRGLFLGITAFEGHYANYSEGGFYLPHRDSFREGGDRIVSVVLYLNKNWQTGDGGELRLHHEKEIAEDIPPVGGTLVCFFSRELKHEVLLNHQPRHSFTGWYKAD